MRLLKKPTCDTLTVFCYRRPSKTDVCYLARKVDCNNDGLLNFATRALEFQIVAKRVVGKDSFRAHLELTLHYMDARTSARYFRNSETSSTVLLGLGAGVDAGQPSVTAATSVHDLLRCLVSAFEAK